jgi:dihydrofolate reductase
MTLQLSIIAALAENNVIGNNNLLIWRLKSDMKRFRSLTMGTPMIMGRKTYDSIGKPLPGRETIVLTRDPGFTAQGVTLAFTLHEALARAREIAVVMKTDRISIAGGAQVYALTMPIADELRLTIVHAKPEGDALFPAIDHARYVEKARQTHSAGTDDEFAFTFLDYQRRDQPIAR